MFIKWRHNIPTCSEMHKIFNQFSWVRSQSIHLDSGYASTLMFQDNEIWKKKWKQITAEKKFQACSVLGLQSTAVVKTIITVSLSQLSWLIRWCPHLDVIRYHWNQHQNKQLNHSIIHFISKKFNADTQEHKIYSFNLAKTNKWAQNTKKDKYSNVWADLHKLNIVQLQYNNNIIDFNCFFTLCCNTNFCTT